MSHPVYGEPIDLVHELDAAQVALNRVIELLVDYPVARRCMDNALQALEAGRFELQDGSPPPNEPPPNEPPGSLPEGIYER